MKLINPKSRRGLVNLLSDFVLKKIGQNTKTIVQITDCGNFFVINGLTETKEILDTNELLKEFKEQNKDYSSNLISNIIDLIKYEEKIEENSDFWFTFFNSKKSWFHPKTIQLYEWFSDNTNINHFDVQGLECSDVFGFQSEERFNYGTLQISSEFPYGFGIPVGRNKLYYSEYLCNQVFKVTYSNKINFKFSNQIIDDDFQIVVDTNKIFSDKDVKSLILDVFDFNLEKFDEKLKNYDIMEDLLNPFDHKPWLVYDKMKDLIIF